MDNLYREHVNKKAGDLAAHLFEDGPSKVPRLPATESDAPSTLPTSVTSPLTLSETFRGSQIVQPGGAANFLIILTSSYLA
jgi:hypothetical protein